MSQDGLVNAEGRKLLNFCEKMGLTVLNGRKNGDEMGNLTFVGGGGSSVLDLVLKLEDEEEPVEKIEVLPRVNRTTCRRPSKFTSEKQERGWTPVRTKG